MTWCEWARVVVVGAVVVVVEVVDVEVVDVVDDVVVVVVAPGSPVGGGEGSEGPIVGVAQAAIADKGPAADRAASTVVEPTSIRVWRGRERFKGESCGVLGRLLESRTKNLLPRRSGAKPGCHPPEQGSSCPTKCRPKHAQLHRFEAGEARSARSAAPARQNGGDAFD